ncbi:YdcF family protein [Nitrospirillum sp. BR 11164]|uniref:YdcF family protein n=1 Tax=Nitrospirillum sp. BR 11164 TaxID=3104324 RepID=UPI002AFED849|nr:YdcF family protein [Nitrospirillum sp. BR 11164]MEA1648153.1 YdcF family protein [Nitrospirillum sp. BR 11164]
MTPLEFFTVSKIGWYLVAPSHLLVWTALAAAVLAARRHGAALVPATACAATLLVLLTCPVGNWALRPLEGLYPRPAEPVTIDGILVLGEGLNGEVLRDRGVPGVGPDGGTLLAAAALARRHPEARVVFSGGSGELGTAGTPEAEVARHVLTDLGLDGPQVNYEARSRTTAENLVLAKDLAQPAPGQTWLLVASAYHMPRAMLSASRVGWRVIPWPSDYLTRPGGEETHLSLAANLAHLDLATHEALGLAAYRLSHAGSVAP